LLDFAGFDKPSFHMFKTLWDDEPHVHITTQTLEKSIYEPAPDGSLAAKDKWDERTWFWHDVNRHWNYDGGDVAVEVLTNCDAVELFLNGASLGTQRLADNPDHILKWRVPFAAGELEARGSCDASDHLRTAGKPSEIVVLSDRDILPADGYSVAHIEIQVVDEAGNPVRHSETEIEFDVPASLEVLGVDNGVTAEMDRYQATKLTTHDGRALLIVRALNQDVAQIVVRAAGVESATIDLPVR
ncbi:MAG: DUF4982 domain-containing protein, partial [Gammaproteobacteria bacterium]|nr:DUF4982 domain-containing protein [Gammaproteobacteria bacterium]